MTGLDAIAKDVSGKAFRTGLKHAVTSRDFLANTTGPVMTRCMLRRLVILVSAIIMEYMNNAMHEIHFSASSSQFLGRRLS